MNKTKKILALLMTFALVLSCAACSKKPQPAVEPQNPAPTTEPDKTSTDEEFFFQLNSDGIYVDRDGKTIDLGGIHILIRDWWSSGRKNDGLSDYERAQYAYWDEIQKMYNFTIEEKSVDDWDTIPYDYVEYASAPDDGNNYIYTLRTDPAVTTAINQGLMWDLASLSAFDFSDKKFTQNGLAAQFTQNGRTFALAAGSPEPRTGVYINKRLLRESGIDFNEIYDLQARDEWTWEKFEEILGRIKYDTDGDGTDDIYGISCREDIMTVAAIFSNDGSIVGKNDNGEYYYNLEDDKTMTALNWVIDIYKKYDSHDPEGAEWDYYKSEFNDGKSVFMIDDEYCAMPQGFIDRIGAEKEIGFVMFPKGPEGKLVNVWNDNLIVIPANYSKDKAEKLAFAYNLYTEPVPGFEDYNARIADAEANAIFDERAKKETIPMMVSPEHGTIAYHGLIPGMDPGTDLLYWIDGNTDIGDSINSVRDTWKQYIEESNVKG